LEEALQRIRSVADYQFGRNVAMQLFPENVKIVFSKKTGRIRYIYLNDELLATMRPTTGLFCLTIAGARRMLKNRKHAKCFVIVKNEVSGFIRDGGDVFAVHVIEVNDEVRAMDEVVVLDEDGILLAVGRAMLSSGEMKAFKRGVAVKVRHGSNNES